jgi:hypothetical protein
MKVDVRNSLGMVPMEWRAIPHAFLERRVS